MKIYLDCCCIQRPFDDRSQPRIAVEAEAILVVIALCESDHLKLISSDFFITLTNVCSLKINSRMARIRNTPTAIENPIIIFLS